MKRAVDLKEGELKVVRLLLRRHLPGVAAWAYGSRVKWTSRPESDLDLVVFAEASHRSNVADLREAFEESDLPFGVDLFVWDEVPEKFRKNIEAEHVVIQQELQGGLGLAGELPRDWHYVALSELAIPERGITYGIVQPGKHQEDGIPIVRVNDIRFGRINPSDPLRVAPDIAAKYQRTELQGGELVLTLVGTVGESAIVPEELAGWNVARAVAVIPVVKEVGARWVHICLGMRELQHLIRTWCTTTVQATFNLRDVARLPIPVPPTKVRDAIAHILGSLDDKIELNRRMNRTLEQMAAAIFKAWFVDFEPVKAKASGAKSFPSMPHKVFDALPTEFTDSALGPIPMGWDARPLNDVLELSYGKALKADNRLPGSVPVYGSNGAVGWHNEYLVKGPGIVVGRKGNPGIVTWADRDFFPIDTTFYVSLTGASFGLHYVFHMLRSLGLPSLSADSAVPGLNRNMAYMSAVLIPDDALLRSFESLLTELMALVTANSNQTETLAATRDALLPKLLSGEIRVGEAERMVEEVA